MARSSAAKCSIKPSSTKPPELLELDDDELLELDEELLELDEELLELDEELLELDDDELLELDDELLELDDELLELDDELLELDEELLELGYPGSLTSGTPCQPLAASQPARTVARQATAKAGLLVRVQFYYG